ncbi:unnamed protein product [Porites evermanni]|uniref:FAD-dependent oxidoreductase n=1 Tax=Porites evermanni TaxID=104178 RepID=A0ABN8SEL9_9CNID|nr:unnamed protein product [Porites evermanni]
MKFCNCRRTLDIYNQGLLIRPNVITRSTESCPDNQVAVVGGGVAGLAATASLSKAGFDVVLLEAPDYFGGRASTAFQGFCTS